MKSLYPWLLAVALSFPGAAIAAEPASIDVFLSADVTVDAQGRVQSLQWSEAQGLRALVAQRIDATVRGWQFEPGKINGIPTETRTGLSVRVVASDAPDGDVRLRFAQARTGPAKVMLVPPRYPFSASKSGVSAKFVVTVDVAEDGSVSLFDSTFLGNRGERGRAALQAAVEAAVQEWRFVPETVAGHPVTTRLRIPVEFCLPHSDWCRQETMSRNAGLDVPAGTPVALDSAVQLKTDILAQQI